MQRIWRDEVAHRPERVDRRAQHGRERNGRPDEQASVAEPNHRHARGVGEAVERRHRALGDPDLGAERLQVLSIEAHEEAVSAGTWKIVSYAESQYACHEKSII